MRAIVVLFAVVTVAIIPQTGIGQNIPQDISRALVGSTISPSIEIGFSGGGASGAIENNKPGKCPVKTLVYTDGTEKFITEKLATFQTTLSSHQSFPPKTQFTVDKVDVSQFFVQLHLTPVTAGEYDACVRVMLGEQRLSEPLNQIVEDITDVLNTGHARPRDGKVDVEIDMNVLTLVGPSSFTKGDIKIELIPDSDPGIPRLQAHFEPYQPGFKERMRISCGDFSSATKYYTKTFLPSKFSPPGRDVADGGFVVKITNNSSHSINGETIPITSKINGRGMGIVTYVDTLAMLAGSLESSGTGTPAFVKTLSGTFFPNDSGSVRAYVQLPGDQDLSGHSSGGEGTKVDIMVNDVPDKFDPAGNPIQRDSFVFHLTVQTKHVSTKVKIPNPQIVCNKD